MLPASGNYSSLTAAALAQAAATFTLTGTPAVGDTITVNFPAPFNTTAPGVAQTVAIVTGPLTAAQAVSVTTAAAAVVVALNANAAFSKYSTATSALGVVTMTNNALSTPFLVTYGSGSTVTNSFSIGISGLLGNTANGFTYTVSATGGTIATLTTNFVGGTGYKGAIPAYVPPS
jgi:hypothetical protein